MRGLPSLSRRSPLQGPNGREFRRVPPAWRRSSASTGRRSKERAEAAAFANATCETEASRQRTGRPSWPGGCRVGRRRRGDRRLETSFRRTIAARMLEGSQATAPVTLTTTADATNLVSLRAQFKATAQITRRDRPRLHGHYGQAGRARALQEHPATQSAVDRRPDRFARRHPHRDCCRHAGRSRRAGGLATCRAWDSAKLPLGLTT